MLVGDRELPRINCCVTKKPKNSREGGRLCCTALATLMLESYYRYLPVYPETRRELARRLSAAATADGE